MYTHDILRQNRFDNGLKKHLRYARKISDEINVLKTLNAGVDEVRRKEYREYPDLLHKWHICYHQRYLLVS